MPLFKKDFSIFGTKEKTIQIPPSTTVVPSPQPPPPPAPPPPPPAAAKQPPKRPEITHHSTLLLLDKYGLPQEPAGYWEHKIVYETPSSRNEKSRTVFDPESNARQAENRLRREVKVRKAAREARSLEEGWLEGPAQIFTETSEEIENVRCSLRDAGRWENIFLEVREKRRAQARASWFGKESEEEKKCKLNVDMGLRNISALEWTREFEPQTTQQLESSAASIRSKRRTSSSSYITTVSLAKEARNSMFSTTTRSTPRSSIMSMTQASTTTRSTPRSSIMSMTQASTVSSPVSLGMPSPTLSTYSNKGGFWKETAGSQHEKADALILPPPAVAL